MCRRRSWSTALGARSSRGTRLCPVAGREPRISLQQV